MQISTFELIFLNLNFLNKSYPTRPGQVNLDMCECVTSKFLGTPFIVPIYSTNPYLQG